MCDSIDGERSMCWLFYVAGSGVHPSVGRPDPNKERGIALLEDLKLQLAHHQTQTYTERNTLALTDYRIIPNMQS